MEEDDLTTDKSHEEKLLDLEANFFGSTESPDDAAFDQKAARDRDIPLEMARASRDIIKEEEGLKETRRVAEQSPRLGDWMRNIENYEVSKDDHKALTGMDKVFSFLYHSPSAVPAAGNALMEGLLGFIALSEVVGEDLMGIEYDRENHQELLDSAAYFRKNRERYQPQTGDTEVDAALQGGTSLVQMMPFVAAGIATKNPAIATQGLSSTVAGQEYATATEEGLEGTDAAVYGIAQGGIEYITERIPMGTLLGKSGPKQYLKKWGRAFIEEQVTEQMATHSQDFINWRVLNKDKTWEEYVDERPMAAYQTMIATTVAAGGMNTIVIGAEVAADKLNSRAQEVAQPGRGEEILPQLMDEVAQSKTRARAPEQFSELVESLAEEAGIQTVTIDVAGLSEALAQSGGDPAALLFELGLNPLEAVQAVQNGGTVEIRTSKLLSQDAAHENREVLLQHTRLNEDAFTPAQRELETEAVQSEAQELEQMIEAEMKAALEQATDEFSTRQEIAERLTEAATYDQTIINTQADVAAAMVETMSEQTGVETSELLVDIFGAVDQQAEQAQEIIEQQIETIEHDPLTTSTAWRDLTVTARQDDGSTGEMNAGEAFDAINNRMTAAQQMLACIRGG